MKKIMKLGKSIQENNHKLHRKRNKKLKKFNFKIGRIQNLQTKK